MLGCSQGINENTGDSRLIKIIQYIYDDQNDQ